MNDHHSAMSPSSLDSIDSLLDLSSYDNMSYASPSISPADSTKSSISFRAPSATATPTANTILPPRQQSHTAPSHNYEAHKQQTGIPTGALATTLAINNNSQMYAGYGYLSGVDGSSSPDDFGDLVGYGTVPGSATGTYGAQMGMESMDYESPTVDPAFFFPPMPTEYTASSTQQPTIKVEPSNVGRLWPGMHQQQAALAAKAQQQRKQQQMLIQQQQQRHSSVSAPPPPQQQQSRARTRPPTDPIVEEKISQLLNSMRQNSESSNADDAMTPGGHMGNGHRSRKDEEDMDEDERLLASEEGKKLSSKERRQLRNKVSARAFRSRRKEYIGQLEGEIATKVTENSDLRTENRALRDENARLTDLTRMLLSSPSFSGFLDKLSTNPNPTADAPQHQQPTPPAATEQQQQQQQTESSHLSKDVNPYAQQLQLDMNINYAMLPETAPLDMSMLDLSQHDFIYQPQVFSVHSVEEINFDTSVLSGKPSSTPLSCIDEDKLDIPLFNPSTLPSSPAAPTTDTATSAPTKLDAAFDSDPLFSLFAAPSPAAAAAAEADPPPLPLDTASLVAAIQPAKQLLNFELVDAEEAETRNGRAMQRAMGLCGGIEDVVERLRGLVGDE